MLRRNPPATAINTATQWLNGLSTTPTSVTTAVALNSGANSSPADIQDHLVYVIGGGSTVPVPAALPVGLAMLAGMFAVRSLRRRA